MTDRLVTKIMCGRNHRVGAVIADADGIRVDYVAAVSPLTEGPGSPTSWRPNPEAAEAAEAWCRHCAKTYPLMLDETARSGRRAVKLVAMGMWEDPIGVSNRKAQS